MYKPAVFNEGYLTGIEINGSQVTKNTTKPIHFGSRTIGFNRFFRGKMQDIEISKVIRVPYNAPIRGTTHVDAHFFRESRSTLDVYKIVQLQELADEKPPCLQLSLEKVRTNFKDVRR